MPKAKKPAPYTPPACGECGCVEWVAIHHLNGDVRDNTPQNLIFLCRPCLKTQGRRTEAQDV